MASSRKHKQIMVAEVTAVVVGNIDNHQPRTTHHITFLSKSNSAGLQFVWCPPFLQRLSKRYFSSLLSKWNYWFKAQIKWERRFLRRGGWKKINCHICIAIVTDLLSLPHTRPSHHHLLTMGSLPVGFHCLLFAKIYLWHIFQTHFWIGYICQRY